MPRPQKKRRIGRKPAADFYAPRGIPIHRLKGVALSLDGLEALRLADAQGLPHDRAATMMAVSRPTFSRILSQARRTVAKALSNGWAIRIEGGTCELAPPPDGPEEEQQG